MVQVVRRGEDLNTNHPDHHSDGEAESLSIRNESGESLQDIVSIMSIDEVEVTIYIITVYIYLFYLLPPELVVLVRARD